MYESLTQISLYEGIEPHTDPADPTDFARLMLNLTDALRTFAPLGSHTLSLTEFARLMLNLTEVSRCSWKKDTYFIHLNPIYTD